MCLVMDTKIGVSTSDATKTAKAPKVKVTGRGVSECCLSVVFLKARKILVGNKTPLETELEAVMHNRELCVPIHRERVRTHARTLALYGWVFE